MLGVSQILLFLWHQTTTNNIKNNINHLSMTNIKKSAPYVKEDYTGVPTIEIVANKMGLQNCSNVERIVAAGYSYIVQKGLFNVGDKVVVIRPYCQLPKWGEIITQAPEGRYLKANKGIVKPVRIRGHWSFGLALHLSLINALDPDIIVQGIPVGHDITDLLGTIPLIKKQDTTNQSSQSSQSSQQTITSTTVDLGNTDNLIQFNVEFNEPLDDPAYRVDSEEDSITDTTPGPSSDDEDLQTEGK